MNDQAVQGVANTDPSRFRVENNISAFLNVAAGIKISVNNTSTGLNYRYSGIVTNIVDQLLAAARNNNINIANSI